MTSEELPSPSDFDQTLVIAHRGAWGTAGENTLEAFAEAIALGADMIEFDLRRTRDGRLIAFHDDTVGGVPTSSLRYDDLAAAGLRPPLLEEVLDLAHGRIRLDVELKEAGYPDRAIGALRGFGSDNCLLSSFLEEALLEVRALAPELRTGLLVGGRPHGRLPFLHALWVALGEKARTIVVLDTSEVDKPRVIARFDPGFPAHDLAFSPDGRRAWITSAAGPDVTVFRVSDHRPLFRVPVGPPPQHIAFAGASVYLTSDYGSTIEQVSASTGRLIRRVRSPYGSFELDAADGFVTTASLLDGKLAIYTPLLRLLHVIKVGPATRDVEISSP